MLSQDSAMPYMWRYLDSDFEMLYFLEPFESDLRAWTRGDPTHFYFMHNTANSCRTSFINQTAPCAGGMSAGVNGTGVILLP